MSWQGWPFTYFAYYTLEMSKNHTVVNLLIIPILCLGLMLLPMEIRSGLYLDISKLHSGEYWRIVSGHFIHISWTHYAMNISGLVLLSFIYPTFFSHYRWILCVLLIAILISFALVLFSDDLKWYVGFSGVLSGLFAAAAIENFQTNRVMNTAILVLLTVYIAFQVYSGELVPGAIDGLSTSSYAHLFGL